MYFSTVCNQATKNRPDLRRGGFFGLGSLHIDSVEAFRRLFGVKRNGITFMKFVVRNSNESVAVKEQVFRQPLSGDKSEALLCELLDSTSHLIDILND